MPITPGNPIEFAIQDYTFVSQLIAGSEREKLCGRAIERSKTRTMAPDTRVPGTPAASADPHMEDLLERLVPTIEQITQQKIFPTYSYFRVYKTGDVLERHTDRAACEISVSVNLGYAAESPWPIWIEGRKGPSAVAMQPGDAVVYRGIVCPHWREAFNGEYAVQVFLHYVDQHDPLAEWKFDKRRRLGTIPNQPIRVAEHIGLMHDAGVLRLGLAKSVKLNLWQSLIMKDLNANRTIPEVIRHVMDEFLISEFEAEALVLKFVYVLEDQGVLIL